MPPTTPALALLLTILGAAAGQNDCQNCLRLDSEAVVGIVACDVIITMLIALMAFWVSNNVLKKKYEEKLKEKTNAAPNDHTYEHLQVQTSDVYNDLNMRRP